MVLFLRFTLLTHIFHFPPHPNATHPQPHPLEPSTRPPSRGEGKPTRREPFGSFFSTAQCPAVGLGSAAESHLPTVIARSSVLIKARRLCAGWPRPPKWTRRNSFLFFFVKSNTVENRKRPHIYTASCVTSRKCTI